MPRATRRCSEGFPGLFACSRQLHRRVLCPTSTTNWQEIQDEASPKPSIKPLVTCCPPLLLCPQLISVVVACTGGGLLGLNIVIAVAFRGVYMRYNRIINTIGLLFCAAARIALLLLEGTGAARHAVFHHFLAIVFSLLVNEEPFPSYVVQLVIMCMSFKSVQVYVDLQHARLTDTLPVGLQPGSLEWIGQQLLLSHTEFFVLAAFALALYWGCTLGKYTDRDSKLERQVWLSVCRKVLAPQPQQHRPHVAAGVAEALPSPVPPPGASRLSCGSRDKRTSIERDGRSSFECASGSEAKSWLGPSESSKSVTVPGVAKQQLQGPGQSQRQRRKAQARPGDVGVPAPGGTAGQDANAQRVPKDLLNGAPPDGEQAVQPAVGLLEDGGAGLDVFGSSPPGAQGGVVGPAGLVTTPSEGGEEGRGGFLHCTAAEWCLATVASKQDTAPASSASAAALVQHDWQQEGEQEQPQQQQRLLQQARTLDEEPGEFALEFSTRLAPLQLAAFDSSGDACTVPAYGSAVSSRLLSGESPWRSQSDRLILARSGSVSKGPNNAASPEALAGGGWTANVHGRNSTDIRPQPSLEPSPDTPSPSGTWPVPVAQGQGQPRPSLRALDTAHRASTTEHRRSSPNVAAGALDRHDSVPGNATTGSSPMPQFLSSQTHSLPAINTATNSGKAATGAMSGSIPIPNPGARSGPRRKRTFPCTISPTKAALAAGEAQWSLNGSTASDTPHGSQAGIDAFAAHLPSPTPSQSGPPCSGTPTPTAVATSKQRSSQLSVSSGGHGTIPEGACGADDPSDSGTLSSLPYLNAALGSTTGMSITSAADSGTGLAVVPSTGGHPWPLHLTHDGVLLPPTSGNADAVDASTAVATAAGRPGQPTDSTTDEAFSLSRNASARGSSGPTGTANRTWPTPRSTASGAPSSLPSQDQSSSSKSFTQKLQLLNDRHAAVLLDLGINTAIVIDALRRVYASCPPQFAVSDALLACLSSSAKTPCRTCTAPSMALLLYAAAALTHAGLLAWQRAAAVLQRENVRGLVYAVRYVGLGAACHVSLAFAGLSVEPGPLHSLQLISVAFALLGVSYALSLRTLFAGVSRRRELPTALVWHAPRTVLAHARLRVAKTAHMSFDLGQCVLHGGDRICFWGVHPGAGRAVLLRPRREGLGARGPPAAAGGRGSVPSAAARVVHGGRVGPAVGAGGAANAHGAGAPAQRAAPRVSLQGRPLPAWCALCKPSFIFGTVTCMACTCHTCACERL